MVPELFPPSRGQSSKQKSGASVAGPPSELMHTKHTQAKYYLEYTLCTKYSQSTYHLKYTLYMHSLNKHNPVPLEIH